MPPEAAPTLGVYVHWPFCTRICPYCDFNVHKTRAIDPDLWARAYRAELQTAASRRPEGHVESVFFGGGTPSLMPPALIEDVLKTIDDLWGLADAEISLEANPADATPENLHTLAGLGVNRLSLGVQSFDNSALDFLGRNHDAATAFTALDHARRVFARVSCDIIYARPDQTCDDWAHELDIVLAHAPDHLSLYQLTIEPNTAFHTQAESGRLRRVADDHAAALYEITQTQCAAAGLPAYEISNHARAGDFCRHNRNIWQGGDYIGIGPGAAGRLTTAEGRLATHGVAAPADWLAHIEGHGHGWEDTATLDAQAQRDEMLLSGLRLCEGIAWAHLTAHGVTPDTAAELVAAGLLETTPTHLAATARGRLLLDYVVAELVKA